MRFLDGEVAHRLTVLALAGGLAGGLVGCSTPGVGVDTTVFFDQSVGDETLSLVTSLQIETSGDETFTGAEAIAQGAMRTERFVYRPMPTTRSLIITITALDAQGGTLASGMSPLITVAPDRVTSAGVVLRATTTDGGVDQTSPQPDDAVNDGSVVDSSDGSMPVQGTISWVQTAFTTSATNIGFSNMQTAGNLNVVVMAWGDITTTITSVTDTQGNTYAVAAPTVSSVQGTNRQAIYYAKNIVAGANTVTVAFNATPAFPALKILEYAGADTSAPFDKTAVGNGTSQSGMVSTASVTTSSASELLVGAGISDGYITGPGTGFTQRVLDSDGTLVEDRTVSAIGSYSAACNLGASPQGWTIQMATFRAAP